MKRIALLIFCLPILMNCASMNHSMLKTMYNDELMESEKLIRTGNYKRAHDELSMLIRVDPKNERALLLRGVANQNLERFSFAIRDYVALLELNPKAAEACYNLGMIYTFILNDSEPAKKYFECFARLKPNHSEAFHVSKILASL